MKYIIGNLSYGPIYTRLFLDHHLKSVMDESNLPAIAKKHEVRYWILTDKETLPLIENHPLVKKLQKLIQVRISVFEWPPGPNDRYGARYSMGMQLFKDVADEALKTGAVASVFAADLVVAQGFFEKILNRIEEGHDAVLGLPIRCAAEPMVPLLTHVKGALRPLDLFEHAYKNLHPLWVAAHWNAPQFVKLPFVLLWDSNQGFLARTFSVSPYVFKVYPEMLTDDRVLDASIPGLCKNPYWAEDWLEAPIAGVELLSCYYPPFENKNASVENVSSWSMCLAPVQRSFLPKKFFIPSRSKFASVSMETASSYIVEEITKCIEKKTPPKESNIPFT